MKHLWLLFALLCVSACGFTPLYRMGSQETTRETASIEIMPIPNEDGYHMMLDLEAKLNPEHLSIPKTYELHVILNSPIYTDQSIQGDNFASLEKITLTASYQLLQKGKKEPLLNSGVQAAGSYNIIKEPYATTVDKENLQHNLVKVLSNDIALHVTAFFKAQGKNE